MEEKISAHGPTIIYFSFCAALSTILGNLKKAHLMCHLNGRIQDLHRGFILLGSYLVNHYSDGPISAKNCQKEKK